jgi:hypothetical protein
MYLSLRTDAENFNERARAHFMPASYGRRIGWAIEARMARHCNFSPAIMIEGLLEHPATYIDSRIDSEEDIAICWANGVLDRVEGENIALLVNYGNNVTFHSDRESPRDSSDSSSSAASEQAPAPRVARAPDAIDPANETALAPRVARAPDVADTANELAPAPRVARAPDVIDLTLGDTTDDKSEAKTPPDDISTSAAEDALENAVCSKNNAKEKPVALDNDSDEDIVPKPASGNGSDIVDSVMGENLDIADSVMSENSSSPVDSDGYTAGRDSVMSFDFFGDVMHEACCDQMCHNQVYDACDEYSQSTVTSMEFERETAVMDDEVAALRALLIALKKRANEPK